MISDIVLDWLTGHGVLLPAAVFAALGLAVFAIASRLARHADAIADATGLGRLWIGTVLLAASTSLPELTTDVNAALLDKVDIGVGDLIGSTLANMLILALVDLVYARRRILDQVALDHVLVGALAVGLTAAAGAAIASGGWGRIGHLGTETIIIAGAYIFGMRAVYNSTMAQAIPPEQLELGDTRSSVLRQGLMGFGLAAVGLVLTAPFLVLSAEAVAIESGLSQTFVGTLFVGFTTSFPEIAATVAAVRMGAPDLAIGNIFGSNAFNICVLFAMDVAYLKGPVLAHVSSDNLIGAFLAVLAISLGMLAILARRRPRVGVVRLESVLIVLTYAGAAWLLAAGPAG
jgi:cation:H+ antiporter